MALHDTREDNSGGASFLHAGCVGRARVLGVSRRRALFDSETRARHSSSLLVKNARQLPLPLQRPGLTLNPQSEAFFSLSCQIPTPTQEKGSTFCQMLRPLPLEKPPANLALQNEGAAGSPLLPRLLPAGLGLGLGWSGQRSGSQGNFL